MDYFIADIKFRAKDIPVVKNVVFVPWKEEIILANPKAIDYASSLKLDTKVLEELYYWIRNVCLENDLYFTYFWSRFAWNGFP